LLTVINLNHTINISIYAILFGISKRVGIYIYFKNGVK